MLMTPNIGKKDYSMGKRNMLMTPNIEKNDEGWKGKEEEKNMLMTPNIQKGRSVVEEKHIGVERRGKNNGLTYRNGYESLRWQF